MTTTTPPDVAALDEEIRKRAAQTAKDEAPKRAPSSRKRASKANQLEDIADGLSQYAIMASMLLASRGDQWAAIHVAENHGPVIEAWVNLAADNARVRKVLAAFAVGGAYGEVATVSIMFMAPLLEYYGRIPKLPVLETFGVEYAPEEVKTQAAQRKAERKTNRKKVKAEAPPPGVGVIG